MDKYNYSYIDEKGIYCYKDSGVLINKLDVQVESTFVMVERFLSGERQLELRENPIKGNYDLAHLKAIHKYLFQDIYHWAGKIRSVAIAKGNLFCLPQYIESYANDIFGKLKRDNYYQGYDKEQFLSAITNLLADINALHPFREGNGRTQREFIKYVAALNGYDFDWSKVNEKENIVASYESVNGDNTKLKDILRRIIIKIEK